jgi:hypothetical protein
VLEQLEREDRMGIVLLGRPYHNDPGVNHEILEEFQKLGYPVFTQDCLPIDDDIVWRLFGDGVEAGEIDHPMAITDVWKNSYSENTSRKVWAAKYVARHPNLVALELSSFKCGHDAPIYSVVEEIVEHSGTPYFCFKDIDENKPTGSIRIRVETIGYFLKRYVRDDPRCLLARDQCTESGRTGPHQGMNPDVALGIERVEIGAQPCEARLLGDRGDRNHGAIDLVGRAAGQEDLERGSHLAAANTWRARAGGQQHLVHVVVQDSPTVFVIDAGQADGEGLRQRVTDRIRMAASLALDHLDLVRVGMCAGESAHDDGSLGFLDHDGSLGLWSDGPGRSLPRRRDWCERGAEAEHRVHEDPVRCVRGSRGIEAPSPHSVERRSVEA